MPHPFDVLVYRNRTVADHEERTLTVDVHCLESPTATEIAKMTAPSAAESTWPLVAYVYGDAWGTSSTGQLARQALDIADGGFAATEVSYRLGHEAPFSTQIGDVCEGIGWLMDRANEFGVDTDVVAAVGHSAGTYLALLATLSGDEFGRRANIDATIRVSGVYNLRTGDHEHAGEPLPLFKNRSPATELRRRSPITYVDDDIDADADAPPTLLPHRGGDSVVAPGQSARLADMLEEVGAQVEYDAIDAADHILLHSSYHCPVVQKRVFSLLRKSL